MTSLISLVLKKAEFDEKKALGGAFDCNHHHKGTKRLFTEGAKWQSEQSLPLIRALAEQLESAEGVLHNSHDHAPLVDGVYSNCGACSMLQRISAFKRELGGE